MLTLICFIMLHVYLTPAVTSWPLSETLQKFPILEKLLKENPKGLFVKLCIFATFSIRKYKQDFLFCPHANKSTHTEP